MTSPRNGDLEQAIVEHPDNTQPYLVFADWLQEQGDPRGELITLQIEVEHKALGAENKKQNLRRQKAILRKYYPTVDTKLWTGGPPKARSVAAPGNDKPIVLRWGFIRKLDLHRKSERQLAGVLPMLDDWIALLCEEIDLRQTKFKELRPMSAMKHLRALDLMHTSVEDLSPLVGLPRLEALSVDMPRDIDALKTLPRLRRLFLRDFHGDVGPLMSLPHLEWLNLDETTISRQQIAQIAKNAPNVTIERNGDFF